MVLWQAFVLAAQILLLVLAWALYQQAKSNLTAHAAETPVLSEVKALQRNVKGLLAEIENTAEQTGSKLESRCRDARELLTALEHEIQIFREAEADRIASRPVPSSTRHSLAADEFRSALDIVPPPSAIPATQPTEEPEHMQEIVFSPDNVGQAPSGSTTKRPTDDRRRRVYALADAGESMVAIASATQLSTGEVETLLGLRNQRRDP